MASEAMQSEKNIEDSDSLLKLFSYLNNVPSFLPLYGIYSSNL